MNSPLEIAKRAADAAAEGVLNSRARIQNLEEFENSFKARESALDDEVQALTRSRVNELTTAYNKTPFEAERIEIRQLLAGASSWAFSQVSKRRSELSNVYAEDGVTVVGTRPSPVEFEMSRKQAGNNLVRATEHSSWARLEYLRLLLPTPRWATRVRANLR